MSSRKSDARERYSTFLTRVRYQDGILQIDGRTGLALTVVTLFAAALLGILWQGLPMVPMAGTLVGLLIPCWAFVDLYRATARLRYHPRSDFLQVERRSGSRRFAYQGAGFRFLNLQIKRTSSDTSSPEYMVQLVVEHPEAVVPFQLHNAARSWEAAQALADRWQASLRVPVRVVGLRGPAIPAHL